MSEQAKSGLSRRDLLKRGAVLGGAAVAWATPMVRAVALTPVSGASPSPACNVWYAVKIDPDSTNTNHCVDIYDQTSIDTGKGHCLDVDLNNPAPEQGGCAHIVSVEVYPDGSDSWVVTLDSGCQFVEGHDGCFIKTGSQEADFCLVNQCEWDPDAHTLTFPQPETNSISHVEFVFCCED